MLEFWNGMAGDSIKAGASRPHFSLLPKPLLHNALQFTGSYRLSQHCASGGQGHYSSGTRCLECPKLALLRRGRRASVFLETHDSCAATLLLSQAQYCADKAVAAVFAIVSVFHAVPNAAFNIPDVAASIEQQPLTTESVFVNKEAPWCEPVLFHPQGCSDPVFGHHRILARLAQKGVLRPGAPGMGKSATSRDWTYPLIDLTSQAAKNPVVVSCVPASSRMA